MGYEREKYPTDIERQSRIDVLLGKDVVSAEDLMTFIYLLWDLGQKTPLYGGEMILPDREVCHIQPIKIYVGLPEESSINITLLDRFGDESGEEVCLVETDGKLEWRTAVSDRYFSKFLGIVVNLVNESGESILSEEPLGPWPIKRLRNIIHQAYQASGFASTASSS